MITTPLIADQSGTRLRGAGKSYDVALQGDGQVSLIERLFLIASLVLFIQGFFVFLSGDADVGLDPTDTRPLLQALYVPIYLGTIALAFRHRRKVWQVASSLPGLCAWLVVCLALVSAAWSEVPLITIRRGLALAGTTLFANYLAARYSSTEQLRILNGMVAAIAVVSLATALIFPEYGTMQLAHWGDWRGVFSEKNSLGRFAAFGLASTIFAGEDYLFRRRKSGIARLFVAIVLGILAVTSGSATAIVTVCLLLTIRLLLVPLRWKHTALIPAVIAAGLITAGGAFALLNSPEAVFNSLGRESTLTGRTELWNLVIRAIGTRPALGYGFGGFWLGLNGPSAAIWTAMNWSPPHSHNGILDLALDLGAVGVSVFLLGFIITAYRAIQRIRFEETTVAMWPTAFIAFMFMNNVTESTALRHNSIYWIFYVVVLMTPLGSNSNELKNNALHRRRGARPLTLHGQARPAWTA